VFAWNLALNKNRLVFVCDGAKFNRGVGACENFILGLEASFKKREEQAYMSKDGATFEGWLFKKGQKRKNWKKRYFRLRGNDYLVYFSDEKSSTPLGSIPLPRSEVNKGSEEGVFTIQTFLESPTHGRCYYLRADTKTAQEGWVRALRAKAKSFIEPEKQPSKSSARRTSRVEKNREITARKNVVSFNANSKEDSRWLEMCKMSSAEWTLREGFLERRESWTLFSKLWKPKLYRLEFGNLFEYESERSSKPNMRILLSECSMEDFDSDPDPAIQSTSFQLSSKKVTLILRAASTEEMMRWLSDLIRHQRYVEEMLRVKNIAPNFKKQKADKDKRTEASRRVTQITQAAIAAGSDQATLEAEFEARLNMVISQLKKEIEIQAEETEELQNELREKKREIKALKSQAIQDAEQSKLLVLERSELSDRIRAMEEEQSVRFRRDTIDLRGQQLEIELKSKQLAEENTELQSRLDRTKVMLDDVQSDLKVSRERAADAGKTADAERARAQDLEEQIAALTARLGSAERTAGEQKLGEKQSNDRAVKKLEDENSALMKRTAQLEELNAAQRTKTQELENELSGKNQSLKSTIEGLERQIRDSSNSLSTWESRHKNLLAEMEKIERENRARNEQQSKEIELGAKANGELKNHLENSMSKSETLERELGETKRRLSEKDSQLQAIERASQERAEDQRKVSKVKEEVSQEKAKVERELKAAEAEMQRVVRERESACAERENARAEREKIEAQKKQLERDLLEIERKKSAEERAVKNLEQDKAGLARDADAEKLALKRVKDEREAEKTALERMKQDRDNERAALDRLKKERESERAALDRVRADIESERAALSKAQKEREAEAAKRVREERDQHAKEQTKRDEDVRVAKESEQRASQAAAERARQQAEAEKRMKEREEERKRLEAEAEREREAAKKRYEEERNKLREQLKQEEESLKQEEQKKKSESFMRTSAEAIPSAQRKATIPSGKVQILTTIPVYPEPSYGDVSGLVFDAEALKKPGAERAICYNYELDGTSTRSALVLQIESRAFAEGGIRKAFKALDLLEPNKQFVVKISKTAKEPRINYEHDVTMQRFCQQWALNFNASNPPKKIAFTPAWLLELVDRPGHVYAGMEEFIPGEYIKYSNNQGMVMTERNTPQAFSHFTYEKSNHQILIIDVQGVGDFYTDPQVHCVDVKSFGVGNLGKRGMDYFLNTHKCNAICDHLALPHTNGDQRSASKFLCKGTMPFPTDMFDRLNVSPRPILEAARKSQRAPGTLSCVNTLTGHRDKVAALAVNGEFLFSGSGDERIMVWNLKSMSCEQTLSGHDRGVVSLQVDRNFLYAGTGGGDIKVWDLRTWKCKETLSEHRGDVKGLACEGDFLYSGGADKTIRVWNKNTWRCEATLKGHEKGIKALAVSGGYIFSGSNDNSVKVWDAKTQKCVQSMDGAHKHWIKALCLTKNVRSLTLCVHRLIACSCCSAALTIVALSFGI
jgi:hypothetical protein